MWSASTDRGAGPGGLRLGRPAIASPAPGRLEVVARDGVTNDVLGWSFNGSWTGPVRVAATPGGAVTPSIVSWAPGRLDVFAVTSTGRLAHMLNAGAGWSHGENLGLGTGGVPYGQANAVASWSARQLDVFAASSAGRALMHRWFDGTQWRGPETLAAGTGPDRIPLRGLAAASWTSGRLDVFPRTAALRRSSSSLVAPPDIRTCQRTRRSSRTVTSAGPAARSTPGAR